MSSVMDTIFCVMSPTRAAMCSFRLCISSISFSSWSLSLTCPCRCSILQIPVFPLRIALEDQQRYCPVFNCKQSFQLAWGPGFCGHHNRSHYLHNTTDGTQYPNSPTYSIVQLRSQTF